MVFLTQHVRYVLVKRGLHEVGKQTRRNNTYLSAVPYLLVPQLTVGMQCAISTTRITGPTFLTKRNPNISTINSQS
jgi:hypothetical protein